MAHRLMLTWNALVVPAAWISAVSATLGVLTADGIAAAITVVGLALAAALLRMTVPIAKAIREIGFAYAEFRGRLHRELSAKVDENSTMLADMMRQLEEAHAERDDLRGQLASVEAEDREKRHKLRNEMAGQIAVVKTQLLMAEDKIARLKATQRNTDSSHAIAINTLSDSVEMIVDHMDPPLATPVHPPHVEPPDPNSDSTVQLSPEPKR